MGIEYSTRFECDKCGHVVYRHANDIPKGWSILKLEMIAHKEKQRERVQFVDMFKCHKCKLPKNNAEMVEYL